MTSAEILSIKEPELLFSSDMSAAKREFRALVMDWHPDRNKDLKANNVISHVNQLYREACKRILEGAWRRNSTLTFRTDDSKTYKIHYYSLHPFELGEVAISKGIVTYLIDEDYGDLFKEGIKWTESCNYRYANDKMKMEVERYLPKRAKVIHLKDRNILVVEKNPGLVRLRDLVEYFDGKLDPKHAAWVISSIYNLLCYFNFAGIVHGDISLDTYFINPEKHSGALLGGWWYARQEGERLIALPSRTVDNLPSDLWAKKQADQRIDLGLVRLIGREMLGDASGVAFRANRSIPQALSEWLIYGTSGSALKDYEIWQKVIIPAAFGGRYFTELDVKLKDIYTGTHNY